MTLTPLISRDFASCRQKSITRQIATNAVLKPGAPCGGWRDRPGTELLDLPGVTELCRLPQHVINSRSQTYERLIDVGILTESDCVELIRGEILEKPSKGELHAACARKLTQLFLGCGSPPGQS